MNPTIRESGADVVVASCSAVGSVTPTFARPFTPIPTERSATRNCRAAASAGVDVSQPR
jgi:hypothetical protein